MQIITQKSLLKYESDNNSKSELFFTHAKSIFESDKSVERYKKILF